MNKLLCLVLALACCACNEESGSGGTTAPADGPALVVAPTPTPALNPSYLIKHGNGFSCLIADGELWCTGMISNELNSPGVWTRIAAPTDPDGLENITAFAVWDHTVCWQLWVAQIPKQRGAAGHATFCVGPHYLAGAYSEYPIAFAFQSPANDSFQNGQLDHTYAILPFVGADMTLAQFIGLNLIQDSANSVSETTEEIDLQ